MFHLNVACYAFLFAAVAIQILFSLLRHVSADASFVINLTTENFDNIINENEVVLVKFFAPWCGHCKTLAPEYEKAAETLKKKGHSAVLAELDATKEGDIGDTHEIQGFPTLKLFRNRKPELYDGGRNSGAIVEWIESRTGPAVVILTEDYVIYFKHENLELAYMGKFSSDTHEDYILYSSIADQNRSLGKFYASFCEKCDTNIFVYRDEEGEVHYGGNMNEKDLLDFLETESLPYFGAVHSENYRKYAEKNTDTAWMCGTGSDFHKAKENVREVAKNNRKSHSFVFLDIDKYRSHAENALGVTTFPALVVQTKTFRYVYQDFTSDTDTTEMENFVNDIKEGNVSPSLKSEAMPSSNEGPVYTVVGKTFEEIVLNKDKDVLLEVYASWCGHCKKLEPILHAFAQEMVDTKPNLMVVKMDGTLNETPVPNFEWSGFPTIFFVKAGTRTPLKYTGDRTVSGFVEFVKKHGTAPATSAASTISGKSEEL